MSKFATVEGEYAKNKDLNRDDVSYLMEWLEKQPHLPKLSEFVIILFLHSCYYDIESTKTCIDTFYTIKAHCPEFFKNRNPKTNPKELLDLILYHPLSRRTKENYQVIYARLIDASADVYSFPSQVKVFDMSTMLTLRRYGTHNGLLVITDMKGCTFSHIVKLHVVYLKKFFYYLQYAMPVRIKGLHFINSPSFMDKVLAIIKPFMKNELLKILEVHTDDLSTLYKFVPKECLPEDYGGDDEPIERLIEIHRKEFLDNVEFFEEDERLVVDESKRPGKPKTANELFGVEGTFKKLNID